MNHVRTAGRSGWAALVALALALGTLPASASAGTGGPAADGAAAISGTVELPSGVRHEDIYVGAFVDRSPFGWWSMASTQVAADGSFTLAELEAGTDYRVQIQSYAWNHVGGVYAGAGVPLVATKEEGVAVTAPAHGIDMRLLEQVTVSGTFTVPEDFDWGPGPFLMVAERVNADGTLVREQSYYTNQHRDIFSFRKLHPHATYVLRAVDDPDGVGFAPRFAEGYVHVGTDGLIADATHATRFRGDAEGLTVAIRSELATPVLKALRTPEVRGRAVVGETLDVTSGAWTFDDPQLAYAWLRDGVAIAGATGSSYTLTPADLGARITARVTATVAGLTPVTASSDPTARVAPGAAPRATVAPKVTGAARLGKRLTASAGSWSTSGVKVAYQWLRGGKAIKGATSRTYTLKKKDVGKRVSVRVTASKAGYDDGASSSAATKVKKAKAKLAVKAKSVKARKRAKVVVRVKVSGYAKPAGTVRIKYGKKTVKAKLKASAKGKVTVRLPKLTKGRYKLTVRFTASAKTKKYVTKPKATKVTLRVR